MEWPAHLSLEGGGGVSKHAISEGGVAYVPLEVL